MANDQEGIEETIESHEVEEAATGRRWWLSLTMIALGIGAAAVGAVIRMPPLIYAGAILIVAFGLVAAGSSMVGVAGPKGTSAGAHLPRRFKRRTSIRKSGLPARPAEGSEDQGTGQDPS